MSDELPFFFFFVFCSCILHELFISLAFSLTSKNIKTQLQNKVAKYKVFCISCHRKDLLWCHWDMTFSCLEQCFSTVVLDVAGRPISSSFLERMLTGNWSEMGGEGGGEVENEKEPATCLSILYSKAILQRWSGGAREHHNATPGPPKSGLQRWRGIPFSEWETTSCSHLHLIRT